MVFLRGLRGLCVPKFVGHAPRAILRGVSVAIVWTTLLTSPGHAASLFDPALRFRTIPTEHFVIYFHQGAEPLARRLAALAEETWMALRRPLGVQPPPRTHVVLVDQSELANGSATPVPYNTVIVTTAWPAGYEFIGEIDDWLRLVFTHEFTHIVHLDRSEGWARVIRRLFGRMPIGFPNLYLPIWQIEGLATYEESALTGQGRLHAGDFGAVLREAAREHVLEPIDRVNGGLTDWPEGNAPYAYGLGFHQYLADRFGADTLAKLADATARRVPFTASRVFKRVYGESLGTLWHEYERSLIDSAPAAAADTATVRLTHHGFVVSGPRFDRFASDTSGAEIVYSVQTPHGFPALERVAMDIGTPAITVRARPKQLTTRYLGSTTAVGREDLYFDQQELHRNVALYSDLYALSRATGRVRRLTSGARLLDPDLSPDGRTLVAVQDRAGQRNLVLVRLPPPRSALRRASPTRLRSSSFVEVAPERFARRRKPSEGGTPDTTGMLPVRLKPDTTENGGPDTIGAVQSPVVSGFSRTPRIETLIAEPETQFNAPRWSPDGKSIAVERHQLGGLSEIVIVDVATKGLRTVTPFRGVRVVTAAWRPDGRAVVAAAAARDQPFNLYEFPIDDPFQALHARPLTATTGGATWPDISPDGKTIVFVGYTVDGFDLFSMPYPVSGDARPPRDVQSAQTRAADLEPLDHEPRPYSPWPTLRPTSWTPIVEGDSTQVRVGAATAGSDVLGYHAYVAAASWLVSGPAAAEKPGAATPDWTLFYAYNRWRPTVWAAASSATSFFSGPPTASGTTSNATLRERRLEAGVRLPMRHVRVSHLATVSFLTGVDDYKLPDGTISRDRRAVRGGWATSSAHTYGYSISSERGVTVGATAERVPRSLGSFGDATTFTADARAYVPGLGSHHVVALRGAAGVSTGDVDIRRNFHLGGALPNASVIDLGRNAISLLRGFGSDTFAGNHVALVNADYRWPLWRPQRGAGTWPVMLHTVHAAGFADAGHAWTGAFRASAVKTSVGAELSADVVAGHFLRFTSTMGVAWGHDGSGTVRDRATIYARIGHAF